MSDDFKSRLHVLVKDNKSEYNIYCVCSKCSKFIYHRIDVKNWGIIKTGLFEEVNNQKIILDKLYGK